MTDYIKLGKRLVACTHFCWTPGMLTLCGIRLVEGGSDYIIGHRSGPTSKGGGWVDTVDLDGIYPDLSDSATKGCVWQLLREGWQQDEVGTGRWCLMNMPEQHRYLEFYGETEADALVIAMEAAP